MAFFARESEGVGLIDRAISLQDFQRMWSWSTSVTDGRTDRLTDRYGRTTCTRKRNTVEICAIVHCAVNIDCSACSVLFWFSYVFDCVYKLL